MTDRTTPTLGTILTEPMGRDAIHIAVAPVVAKHEMAPGDHAGFVEEGNTELVGAQAKKLLGIIDPFLDVEVQPGQRCWLFLYPNSITGLRHVWAHPDFIARPQGGRP